MELSTQSKQSPLNSGARYHAECLGIVILGKEAEIRFMVVGLPSLRSQNALWCAWQEHRELEWRGGDTCISLI